jgi:hypothetical protein
MRMERCAPCHWVDIDDRVDVRVAIPPANFASMHAVLQGQWGGAHAVVRRL